MRGLLLILAGISGLMNAYMLGNIEEANEENKDNYEDTHVCLGRRGLQEQKASLFRFIRFGILLNVPYIVLSAIYFYGQRVPFILALTLILFLVLEYGIQWRRIRKAKKLEDAVAVNPTFGRF